MTAAETRAMWSRTTPEQWEAATRILVRLCEGKDPETATPAPAPDSTPERVAALVRGNLTTRNILRSVEWEPEDV